MNRLILVRHGGSTGNEDGSFYNYSDSAVCLTTNGIRQALNTAGVLATIDPRWARPGDFTLEVFASEYTRAQQTARITLDQMGLPAARPTIQPLLNERDYGTAYDPRMDSDAAFVANDCESGLRARVRVRGFLAAVADLLDRADVLAFSHFGAIRALVANLVNLSDAEMMSLAVPNGGAFLFERRFDAAGAARFTQGTLPDHVLPKTAAPITPPPAAPPPVG
ncbi:MAG TPA: histidine phosphatase family protein [Caulobacteraceae bacterium]|jgi:broad specificity phosphatase PhoE|nr:histidine phosphatase family protein [Caulobacteraceae bacterium]